MIFAPTDPRKVASQQLYEARRLQLEHASHAEYHAAMRDMLGQRIARLEQFTNPPTKETHD